MYGRNLISLRDVGHVPVCNKVIYWQIFHCTVEFAVFQNVYLVKERYLNSKFSILRHFPIADKYVAIVENVYLVKEPYLNSKHFTYWYILDFSGWLQMRCASSAMIDTLKTKV